MADLAPSFEQVDLLGTTTCFRGSVGTSYVSVPPVPTTQAAEALIDCPTTGNSGGAYLDASFDGGVSFFRVDRGQSLSWNLKGNVTSVYLRGNSSSVLYQLILNREPV